MKKGFQKEIIQKNKYLCFKNIFHKLNPTFVMKMTEKKTNKKK